MMETASVTRRLWYALRHPRQTVRAALRGGALGRFSFDVAAVAAVGPEGNVQNYLDRRSIRRFLVRAAAERPLERALDIGCGYGRVTMVLAEFARDVVAVEREPHLVDLARLLLPGIRFVQQNSILSIPGVADVSCEFVMTFTVLQHMVDEDCLAVLAEIKRVCRLGGFVLLGEKYKPGDETENTTDRTQFLSKHRPLHVWQEWMAPFRLVEATDRPMQPLWRGATAGGLMFFQRES